MHKNVIYMIKIAQRREGIVLYLKQSFLYTIKIKLAFMEIRFF